METGIIYKENNLIEFLKVNIWPQATTVKNRIITTEMHIGDK